jgi:ubiquinone/menaquinone biosynthesis C-methylase UbiE
MDDRTADARKEFDRWSRHYDWDPLQPLFFRPSHRMLLDALGEAGERPLDVLDIGCGTGQFALTLLERYPRARVWGVDLSQGMLHKAGRRIAQAAGRLHLVQGDSARLPFADDCFDAVTCSHSFHHYPLQERVLAEMHRVLRPGGRLLIIDGDCDRLWGRLIFDVLVVLVEGPVHHRTGADFRELYEVAGFAEVTQRRRRGPLPFLMTSGLAVKPLAAPHPCHAA